MTNPVGRPTKYTPELVGHAREYITDYERHGHVIPSIAGLSIVLKVSRKVLYEWKEHPEKTEFSDILAEIITTQENVLINNGLKGEFNSNITKLVLGKHGYHDKKDHEHSGPSGGPIEVQSPAQRLKEQVDAARERLGKDS